MFLAEVRARQHIPYWVENSDGSYTCTALEWIVTRLFKNGVEQDGGDWSWDTATGEITWTGSGDPRSNYMQAEVEFQWSNTVGKVFTRTDLDSLPVSYEPRIKGAPTINLRIPPLFDGSDAQIGGGAITLENGDGFFDSIRELDWDAGYAHLKLGIDYPGAGGDMIEMAYADYYSQGVWAIRGWDTSYPDARLDVKDRKEKIGINIPLNRYSSDDYPSMDTDSQSSVVPLAYGVIQNAAPICINITTGTFQLADTTYHSIGSVDRVTVNSVDVAYSYDLDAGTITIPNWTNDATAAEEDSSLVSGEVLVWFSGYVDGDGVLIYNPADVIEDLLSTWGGSAADLDTAAFAAAASDWNLGTDDATGLSVPIHEISLYVDESTDLVDLCSDIAAWCNGVFYTDLDGQYVVSAWQPRPGDVAEARLTEDHILSEPIEEVDARDVRTVASATYRRDLAADSGRLFTHTGNKYKYRGGLPAHKTESDEVPFYNRPAARLWAVRIVGLRGRPTRIWDLPAVSPCAFELVPGDPVEIAQSVIASSGARLLPPAGIYEVLEVSRDLKGGTVGLVLSPWRGLEDRSGFWVEDGNDFPSWMDVTTSVGADQWDSGWSAAEKKWARENSGYWCDDDGFADPDDEDSYDVSVWV